MSTPDRTPASAPKSSAVPLLRVRDLRIAFEGVNVLRGLDLDVRCGEVLALVGESGAGKSLTAWAVLGMVPREAHASGDVLLDGRPVGPGDRGRRISLVPQDALSALSPVHTVGDQLGRALRSVSPGLSRRDVRALAAAALDRVGIAAGKASAYPHEFSGGMRQRAVIAMAMINEPDLVVADEPTTALDPETQEQVLSVLTEQRAATGAALLLVTHDLGTVRRHADRTAVMYAGRITELAPTDRLMADPRAPYTAGLLAALPGEGGRQLPHKSRLPVIPGQPPTPGTMPPGCAFAPRCAHAVDRCRTELPSPRPLDHDRVLACHRNLDRTALLKATA
ncbi:ABC transporter ATP-binding protein [Streptomyces sp. NPDC001732]